MSPREIEVMEMIGSQVRTGVKPVVVTDTPSAKPRRAVLAVTLLIIVMVSVFLNAAQYEVSEEVPAPIYLDGAK